MPSSNMSQHSFNNPLNLSRIDPGDTGSYRKREDVVIETAMLKQKLDELQEKLYASKKHAVLFIFQGMDCSGKDGVIKQVFSGLNPQGPQTISFKTPTPEERNHDFLWRAHKAIPGRGQIAAFNRSYYEEVLIGRVHQQVSDEEAKGKFKEINHFEELLSDNGVVIVKVFLHISKSFQRKKLIDRIENPEKNWKFDPNDLVERKAWGKYQSCYEDIFKSCSTAEHPWFIVPSDHRWYRDLAVLRLAVDTLESLNLSFPEPNEAYKSLLPELEQDI